MRSGNRIALLRRKAIPMSGLADVQINAIAVFVKFAEATLREAKVLVGGELHPIKSYRLILRHATTPQVAQSQQSLRPRNALTRVGL